MSRWREERAIELFRHVSTFDAVAVKLGRHAVALAGITAAIVVSYAISVAVGFRSTAATSGIVRDPSLNAAVVVRRDARDVPHIEAASERDALFAQGFVEGSDRLFQMELTRRYALGTLTEILGPRALAMDEEQRYYDIRDIARRQWRALNPRERDDLRAFSDGVNAAMRTQPLPVEFRLLLYRPQPWTPQDSLAVSLAVSLALGDSWHDVLARDDVWRRYGPKEFDARFPLSDSRYDVSLNGTLRPSTARPAGAPLRMTKSVADLNSRKRAGSNAWAAGAMRTATGRALLANDPHLDLTIPGLWYVLDLRAPGMHAAGASIPGAPGILLGHNERIAWGATNGDAATMSAFDSGRLDSKNWTHEVFHVRFASDVKRAYYRTRSEFGVPDEYGAGRMVLVRWPPFAGDSKRATAIATFLDLDRARGVRDAFAVLARYDGPAENFVVADTHGNVGYHLAGSIVADGAWGRYVHPASDLQRAFATVPFARMPSIVPAANGTVVSANNKMYGARYPYRLAPYFDLPYRAYRIAELLRARRRYDPAYFAAMQLDTVSPVDRELARRLAEYARQSDEPRVQALARELDAWDGGFEPGSRAATLEHTVRESLESSDVSLYRVMAQLRDRDVSPNLGANLAGLLYYDAHESLKPWGSAGSVKVEHPLASLRFGFLNGATLPGEGDEYTVHLQEPGFSQSFRAVWDVGNWDAGGIAIPSGESGEPGSGHYTDLSAAWIAGRLDSLPFSESAVAAATREQLVLEPETKSLFCAHGGLGLVPNPLPSGYETEFAVAVVEIQTSAAMKNVAVSNFALYDASGKSTPMKRVLNVETFDEPAVSGEGSVAYYLNTADGSKSRPWDGTLSEGTAHLRVRVALPHDPGAPVRYSLRLGPFAIGGPCDIAWPT
jgi:penicillin amidase